MAVPLRRAVSNLVALAIVTSILASAGIYLYAEVVKSYSLIKSSSRIDQPLLIARCWYLGSEWLCGIRALTPVAGRLEIITARGGILHLGNISIEPNQVGLFRISLGVGDEPAKLVLVSSGRVFLYDIDR